MSVFNAYMSLSGNIDGDVLQNERLSRRTTYHIGGPAALFVMPHTYAALTRTLSVLKSEHVDWVIIGKGSNLLVSDKGFDGCVISLDGEFSRIAIDKDACTISAGAGTPLVKVVNAAMKAGLSGLECCAAIPGSLGGAISMNAGNRREWIGSLVRDVVTLRQDKGLMRYEAMDIEWGYRQCSLPTSEIVLEATLQLKPSDEKTVAYNMEKRITERRLRQPLGVPSCGSVFRNPVDHSAGQLIEAAGLKGVEKGGAQISPEHANFIVNRNGATAADVVYLMSLAHDTVRDRFGIELYPEVKLLGFGA